MPPRPIWRLAWPIVPPLLRRMFSWFLLPRREREPQRKGLRWGYSDLSRGIWLANQNRRRVRRACSYRAFVVQGSGLNRAVVEGGMTKYRFKIKYKINRCLSTSLPSCDLDHCFDLCSSVYVRDLGCLTINSGQEHNASRSFLVSTLAPYPGWTYFRVLLVLASGFTRQTTLPLPSRSRVLRATSGTPRFLMVQVSQNFKDSNFGSRD